MREDPRTESHKMGDDCISQIHTEKLNDSRIWYQGHVVTPNGIVGVLYSEPYGNSRTNTLMEFVHDGRRYTRTWHKGFRPRYLTNLARKFAQDIVEGK